MAVALRELQQHHTAVVFTLPATHSREIRIGASWQIEVAGVVLVVGAVDRGTDVCGEEEDQKVDRPDGCPLVIELESGQNRKKTMYFSFPVYI